MFSEVKQEDIIDEFLSKIDETKANIIYSFFVR